MTRSMSTTVSCSTTWGHPSCECSVLARVTQSERLACRKQPELSNGVCQPA